MDKPYLVVFINERGKRVPLRFAELEHARKFCRKIKYSKRCRLVYAPLFD